MSLPSQVILYKDGKEIKRLFTNCGWICNKNTVISAIKRSIRFETTDIDWDEAKAYGMTFTKNELK